MSDAQAGTPAVAPENRDAGQAKPQADGSGLNAQQQKEYMTLKQKAEDYNKLAKENEEARARIEQLERMASGAGAGQATDPTTELVTQLREQATYDPVARATLLNMEMSAKANAEVWLANQLLHVPEAKRDKVAALIRNAGYQMSVENALSLVTDPDTKSYQEQLEEARKEIERLKGAKGNASSPSTTVPASTNADESGSLPEIKQSDYVATLRRGGQAAVELMKAVGENKTRLVPD